MLPINKHKSLVKKLLFLLFGATLWLTGCKEKHGEIHAETKLLTSAVYASGILVPEQEYKVVSNVDGYLVNVFVKEGDVVTKGQQLFIVRNEVRNAQEQGARTIVQKTLPATTGNAPLLRELQGRIEIARLKKYQDSINYMRYKNLLVENVVSQVNYEKYYLQYQSSLKDYQNLKQQYQQQQITNDIQLQQAKNQLAVAVAQEDVGNLRSFVTGMVYDVYKKKGDIITPNQPIALIGSGKMFAKLLVDEDDLDKVYHGQKILITMDAYPDKVFKAHVEKIYPLLSRAEQSFRVDAIIDDPVDATMYGLNLEANIIVAEKKKVLALSKAALLKGDSVLIKKDGKETVVKVKKGIEDDQYVEILAGIDATTTVIVK